ncbi:sulfatase [Roseimicrobium sp. ORNL1]|uniref:sulfatase n=1 Tax=Roseimicrobium sp. ORNL1 TaxID=2711231 RepID=UPI0013E0FDAC|nr:sulfatase [Roseimicrobium sp. ORNL1]QIF04886.1 sulfatase [Roseimicrobium sp. ORNL1]
MIAIDDQNDWLGCLGGHPQVQTPHLDALAARGTLFTNAHCQAPLCNPSRASLMTGLRPSTTGIYGLAPGIRAVDALKKHVTLPQELMKHGYYTYACGKVYHDGSMRLPGAGAGKNADAAEGEGQGQGQGQAQAQGKKNAANPSGKAKPSPAAPGTRNAPAGNLPPEFTEVGPSPGMPKPPQPIAKLSIEGRHPAMDWGVFPEKDEDQADWKIADAAIAKLETAPKDKPWFIAAGFRLPHVPCYASKKWFDLYPDNATLQMPPVKEDDRADLPPFASYLHWRLPEPRLKTLQLLDEWRPLVRGYLASISFMDSQCGRLLKALEKSGQLENTIVIVWGDHGWHLGEKGITGKNTLWERSTRVPFIWAGPGVTAGARCSSPAELLDVFPTLLEMTGLPPRSDLEGHSLARQLKDASAPREHPAITTHNQGNHTIRTRYWRYIRYADGSEELYDEQSDPNEWTNLASDPKYAAQKSDLAKYLPKVDVPPVPGSKNRVLTYDPATKQAVWEEVPIPAGETLPDDILVK